MGDIATMIGALVPTFALSRLTLWMLKTWNGGAQRLIVAHVFALLIATLIGGMGMADGGAFAAPQALATYVLPQAVWFFADLYRHRSKKSEVAGTAISLSSTLGDGRPQKPR